MLLRLQSVLLQEGNEWGLVGTDLQSTGRKADNIHNTELQNNQDDLVNIHLMSQPLNKNVYKN